MANPHLGTVNEPERSMSVASRLHHHSKKDLDFQANFDRLGECKVA